ncbi:MAG: MARVEL domain-containing protein [Bacteroidota bacterium]
MNPSKHKQSNAGTGIVLAVIAVICVSISFIQTALGYELLAGPVFTWLFSLIISAFMLLTNLRLKDALQKGAAFMGILAFYFIIAFFSFAGNFNAFYSQFMKDELFEKELRNYETQIPAIQQRAIQVARGTNNAKEVEMKVNQLKFSLESQILDPANSGFGERAQSILQEIESTLGTKLTQYEGEPKSIATKMNIQIDQVLNAKLAVLTKDSEVVIKKINAKVDEVMPVIRMALLPENIGLQGRNALDIADNTYNTIGEMTKGFEPSFAFEPIKSEQLQVGKISHSFQSGFGKMENPQATLIASLASLAVDFLVPIYLLLTVARREEEKEAPVFVASKKSREKEVQVI